jgi:hypothetical protein
MSVCYIIISCDAYKSSRMQWQKQTFLKSVPDYYYIAGTSDPGERVMGWNTPDKLEDCPLKYQEFFKHSNLVYDWYFFIDDDTFVFPKRLETFLKQYNPSEKLYIGKPVTPEYMDGGGGFLISRPVYEHLCSQENHITSIYGDVCIGRWIGTFAKKISSDLFQHTKHQNDEQLKTCVSFHWLKTKEDFLFYYSIC